MNGVHDCGGMHGFGPVLPEGNEPVFHERWEGRSLALNLSAGKVGRWNIDRARFTRESLPPAEYVTSSYYRIWLLGLERLLVNHGLVGEDELVAGRSLRPGVTGREPMRANEVAGMTRNGHPYARPAQAPARFAVGQRVRARNIHSSGHTRLPGYVRGHVGEIELVHGAFVFPDTNARGDGENPQWCYTVCFLGTELWGDDANPATTISVDAFEPYLASVAEVGS